MGAPPAGLLRLQPRENLAPRDETIGRSRRASKTSLANAKTVLFHRRTREYLSTFLCFKVVQRAFTFKAALNNDAGCSRALVRDRLSPRFVKT